MAIAWFEAGEEEKALKALELANRLMLVETEGARTSLRKAEDKVSKPKRIRQEIESWEKVIEEKPYYRDVLLFFKPDVVIIMNSVYTREIRNMLLERGLQPKLIGL